MLRNPRTSSNNCVIHVPSRSRVFPGFSRRFPEFADFSRIFPETTQPRLVPTTLVSLWDLVKACDFHVMNAFHADLFDHLHQTPPPGYSRVSLAQLLRADRAAWVLIAERITTLKRDEQGKLPLEAELQQVLSHPSVTFHLLPLPAAGTTKTASPKPKPQPRRSRSPKRPSGPAPSKGKGKGKKGGKRGRGPNVPKGLINKKLQTSSGERLCWAFNLDQGCPNAKPGERCNRGIHLCAEPGCEKPHSLQKHQ